MQYTLFTADDLSILCCNKSNKCKEKGDYRCVLHCEFECVRDCRLGNCEFVGFVGHFRNLIPKTGVGYLRRNVEKYFLRVE